MNGSHPEQLEQHLSVALEAIHTILQVTFTFQVLTNQCEGYLIVSSACRATLEALGVRLEKGRISALVDPIQALLQVGLPDGPQLQPRPRKMWQRGSHPCSMDRHGSVHPRVYDGPDPGPAFRCSKALTSRHCF